MLDPDQIRQARHALSLSQHELARRARVSRTALNQFEQRKYKPGPNFCRKLRDYFEVQGIHHETLSEPEPIATPQTSPSPGNTTKEHTTARGEASDSELLEQSQPSPVEILIGVALSVIIGRKIVF